MAPRGSRPYHSPGRNLPLINPIEDELARDSGPVEGLYSGDTFLAPSRNPTSTLISTPMSPPIPTPAAINDLFKKFMKVYLETN